MVNLHGAVSTANADGGHHEHSIHEHHWEVSWGPLVVALGVTLLVPMTFSAYFVYKAHLLAIIFAGLGTPLVLAGVAKWINDGMTQTPAISNVADIGLPIFIVSEILIFLSLFASYWTMRLSAHVWPPVGTPHLNLILPLIMTAILVASSVTYHKGEDELKSGSTGGYVRWLIVSIILGLAFVGCTLYEYGHLIEEHFVPGTNAYSTAFFSLTGFHASHVLVGVLAFVTLLVTAAVRGVNPMFAKCAGIYWHFVDIVWFFVASQVYYW